MAERSNIILHWMTLCWKYAKKNHSPNQFSNSWQSDNFTKPADLQTDVGVKIFMRGSFKHM